MAGSVPKITAANLSVTNGLDDHPVYFVTVGATRLVVKGEAKESVGHDRTASDAAQSIKWGSKIMKNVNSDVVNTKIMDQGEVAAFLAAARRAFKPLPTRPGTAPTPPANRYRNVTDAANIYTWVKMPMVDGLSDAEFTKKVGGFTTVVPKKARDQLVKFTDETLWPQLGKVLAADIFNGNSDRFDIATGDWVNYGNVMFVNQGTNVVGLDTFDPNTAKSNLVKTGRYDELKTLTDHAKRKAFALACTRSVGETLQRDAFTKGGHYITLPINGPDGIVLWRVEKAEVATLYEPFAPAMEAGLKKGSDELKAYLQRKVAQYKQQNAARGGRRPLPVPPGGRARSGGAPAPRPNAVRMYAEPIEGIPQGILDRMNFLGWYP